LAATCCWTRVANYYDQNYEWRKGINFCLKKRRRRCWVRRAARNAGRPVVGSGAGDGGNWREVSSGFHAWATDDDAGRILQHDGIDYLKKRPDELLVDITCRRQTAGVPLSENFAVAARSTFRARASRLGAYGPGGMERMRDSFWRHCAVTNRSFQTPRKRCSKDHSAKNKFRQPPSSATLRHDRSTTPILWMNWRKQMARQLHDRALKD